MNEYQVNLMDAFGISGKENQSQKCYTVVQSEKAQNCPLVGRLALDRSICIPKGSIGQQAGQIYNLHEEFYEFEIPIHDETAILLIPRSAFAKLRDIQPQITIF